MPKDVPETYQTPEETAKNIQKHSTTAEQAHAMAMDYAEQYSRPRIHALAEEERARLLQYVDKTTTGEATKKSPESLLWEKIANGMVQQLTQTYSMEEWAKNLQVSQGTITSMSLTLATRLAGKDPAHQLQEYITGLAVPKEKILALSMLHTLGYILNYDDVGNQNGINEGEKYRQLQGTSATPEAMIQAMIDALILGKQVPAGICREFEIFTETMARRAGLTSYGIGLNINGTGGHTEPLIKMDEGHWVFVSQTGPFIIEAKDFRQAVNKMFRGEVGSFNTDMFLSGTQMYVDGRPFSIVTQGSKELRDQMNKHDFNMAIAGATPPPLKEGVQLDLSSARSSAEAAWQIPLAKEEQHGFLQVPEGSLFLRVQSSDRIGPGNMNISVGMRGPLGLEVGDFSLNLEEISMQAMTLKMTPEEVSAYAMLLLVTRMKQKFRLSPQQEILLSAQLNSMIDIGSYHARDGQPGAFQQHLGFKPPMMEEGVAYSYYFTPEHAGKCTVYLSTEHRMEQNFQTAALEWLHTFSAGTRVEVPLSKDTAVTAGVQVTATGAETELSADAALQFGDKKLSAKLFQIFPQLESLGSYIEAEATFSAAVNEQTTLSGSLGYNSDTGLSAGANLKYEF